MEKLFLVIKKKYFDEIKSGIKKEEYRLVKPYWEKKLIGKQYTHIVFQNGYNKNSPRIEAEYLCLKIKTIKHEFFGNEAVDVFALQLGKIKQL